MEHRLFGDDALRLHSDGTTGVQIALPHREHAGANLQSHSVSLPQFGASRPGFHVVLVDLPRRDRLVFPISMPESRPDNAVVQPPGRSVGRYIEYARGPIRIFGVSSSEQ